MQSTAMPRVTADPIHFRGPFTHSLGESYLCRANIIWNKSSKIFGISSFESSSFWMLTVDQLPNQFSFSYRSQQILPPWDEDWKLDEQFFKDLAAWDDQHRESTFLNVVEKIRDATITCKPFVEWIPNAPFPARALVLALSHFLHLGVVRPSLSSRELVPDQLW
jgi:hypothetical protein